MSVLANISHCLQVNLEEPLEDFTEQETRLPEPKLFLGSADSRARLINVTVAPVFRWTNPCLV